MSTVPNPFETPSTDAQPHAPGAPSDRAAAVSIRQAHINAEASIKAIGTLYVVGAVLGFLGGAKQVLNLLDNKDSGLGAFELGVIIGTLAMYPVSLLVGIGLRRLRAWGRWTAVVISALSLLAFPAGTVVGGLILYTLLNAKARRVFAPDYPDIIRATPEVKYKTSVVVWVAVGVLALVLGAAVVFAR